MQTLDFWVHSLSLFTLFCVVFLKGEKKKTFLIVNDTWLMQTMSLKPSRFCWRNGSYAFYLSSWSQGDQQYMPAFPQSVPAHPVDLQKVKNRMAKSCPWQERNHSTDHPKKDSQLSKYLITAQVNYYILNHIKLCVCLISGMEWGNTFNKNHENHLLPYLFNQD